MHKIMAPSIRFEVKRFYSCTLTVVLLILCYCCTLCHSFSFHFTFSGPGSNKECQNDKSCGNKYYCHTVHFNCTPCDEKEWDRRRQVCWNPFSSHSEGPIWKWPIIIVLVTSFVAAAIKLSCYGCKCCPLHKQEERERMQQEQSNALRVVGTATLPTATNPPMTFGHGDVTANGTMSYGIGTSMYSYTSPPPPCSFSR